MGRNMTARAACRGRGHPAARHAPVESGLHRCPARRRTVFIGRVRGADRGRRAVERVRGSGRPASARVGAEARQGLAASVTGWGRASGARRPGASRPVRWPVAIARGRGSSVRPSHRSSSPTGPAGGSRRDSPKGIGLIATTTCKRGRSDYREVVCNYDDCCNPPKGIGLIATELERILKDGGLRNVRPVLQSPEGDWADCDDELQSRSRTSGRGGALEVAIP
jgi:hypothetical protein